ncbi:hypothetical protein ACWD26_24240 [Streptomyces sp. NPDC002787]
MVFFLVLLGGAIALVVIGAVVDGVLYLLSIAVLLLIAAVLYLLVRSVSRSRRRRSEGSPRHPQHPAVRRFERRCRPVLRLRIATGTWPPPAAYAAVAQQTAA